MEKIIWANLLPLAAGERERLDARLAKLEKIEDGANKATGKFAQVRTPQEFRIRPHFVVRDPPAAAPGDPSDRLLPARSERPPATRLTSPRGIALKVYLTALFLAQTRSPRERPGNKMPLADPDRTSWIDLIATSTERGGGLRTYSSVRDKKLRQVQDAVRRLSDRQVQLVELPNFQSKATGKYEGFLLMHERGAPYGGGDNAPYTVPAEQGRLLRLPPGLLLNGWIHVLEDTELTFLLMLACMRARFGNKPVFVASEIRLLQFGLGRDAYQAHHMLNRLGLIEVEEDPNRHVEGGQASGFSKDNPPKLHRFRLIDSGFDQSALATMRAAIQGRLGKTSVAGRSQTRPPVGTAATAKAGRGRLDRPGDALSG